MPRYDYKCEKCGYIAEVTHPISSCDDPSIIYCQRGRDECHGIMTRLISAPHVEGSAVYPFNLWNIRTDKNGPGYVTINNKTEHKKVLADRGFSSPFFSVGG